VDGGGGGKTAASGRIERPSPNRGEDVKTEWTVDRSAGIKEREGGQTAAVKTGGGGRENRGRESERVSKWKFQEKVLFENLRGRNKEKGGGPGKKGPTAFGEPEL